MISTLSIPKVLFIRGVFKRDCQSDDIFEKKIIESISSENMSDASSSSSLDLSMQNYIFEKLPSVFESIIDWPTSTNILCWNCNLPFASTPIFIPTSIEPIISKIKENKYSIGVKGVFCWFSCAWHFIHNRQMDLIDRIETLNKLKFLHKLITGNPMKDIVSYPSPFEMKQYGGDLTIEQYREKIARYKTL